MAKQGLFLLVATIYLVHPVLASEEEQAPSRLEQSLAVLSGRVSGDAAVALKELKTPVQAEDDLEVLDQDGLEDLIQVAKKYPDSAEPQLKKLVEKAEPDFEERYDQYYVPGQQPGEMESWYKTYFELLRSPNKDLSARAFKRVVEQTMLDKRALVFEQPMPTALELQKVLEGMKDLRPEIPWMIARLKNSQNDQEKDFVLGLLARSDPGIIRAMHRSLGLGSAKGGSPMKKPSLFADGRLRASRYLDAPRTDLYLDVEALKDITATVTLRISPSSVRRLGPAQLHLWYQGGKDLSEREDVIKLAPETDGKGEHWAFRYRRPAQEDRQLQSAVLSLSYNRWPGGATLSAEVEGRPEYFDAALLPAYWSDDECARWSKLWWPEKKMSGDAFDPSRADAEVRDAFDSSTGPDAVEVVNFSWNEEFKTALFGYGPDGHWVKWGLWPCVADLAPMPGDGDFLANRCHAWKTTTLILDRRDGPGQVYQDVATDLGCYRGCYYDDILWREADQSFILRRNPITQRGSSHFERAPLAWDPKSGRMMQADFQALPEEECVRLEHLPIDTPLKRMLRSFLDADYLGLGLQSVPASAKGK
jgi:hypothetical protein